MPAAPTPERLGVITVAFRSDDVLPRFLASLDAQPPAVLLVADNEPSETSSTKSLAEAAGGRYLPISHNPGYGGAVNIAARELPADVAWILVANPDVELRPGAVDRLLTTGRESAAIGTVGPLIRTPDGAVYPSARSLPSLRTGIGHALFANVWPDNPWSRSYRHEQDAERRDAGWLSGACLLIRRSAFDEVGGFDDRYFMYFEDVDLGYRISMSGYRNVYEPAAEVLHIGAHSTRSLSDEMLRAHHDSARRFLSRKYRSHLLWPIRVALTLGLRARYLVVRLRNSRARKKGSPSRSG